MSGERLTVGVEAQGAKEAQAELQGVTNQVEKLGGATGGAAQQTQQQADANTKADASWRQVVGVLRLINPELAQYVDGLLKAGTLAEGVTGQGGGLARLLDSVIGRLRGASGGLLGVVAAAAVAAVGIAALAKRWRELQAQIESARKEQERFIAGQSRLQAGRLDTEDEVRSVAQRQREPVSADDIRRATTQAERLIKRGVGRAAAIDVAGGLAGPALAEGGELGDIDELERLARAVEQGLVDAPDPRKSRGVRTRRARRIVGGRAGTEVGADAELDREVQQERRREANRELERASFVDEGLTWDKFSSVFWEMFGQPRRMNERRGEQLGEFHQGGGTENLRRLVQELRGNELDDKQIDRLVRLIQLISALEEQGFTGAEALRLLEGRIQAGKEPQLSESPLTSKEAIDARNILGEVRAAGGRQKRPPPASEETRGFIMDLLSATGGPGFSPGMGRGFRGGAGEGEQSLDQFLSAAAKLDAAANLLLKAMEAQAMAANHTVGVTPLRGPGTATGVLNVREAAEG